MPWSGGVYTRGYPSWTNDANNNLPISATKFDTEDNDFAAGLNNCATVDGLNKMQASFVPLADNSYDFGSASFRWRNIYLGGGSITGSLTVGGAATHQQFASGGAKIQRVYDRMMVADAGVNDGNFPNVTKDWLTTFQIAQAGGPTNGTILGAQFAVLADSTAPMGGAILAGAQSLNFTSTSQNIIAFSAFAVNNNATLGIDAWGGYIEIHRVNNTVAQCIGLEIDVRQLGSLQQMTPYAQAGGETVCYLAAAGAGLSATGQFNATAAFMIGANPMAFDKGIVFMATSIAGSNGVTGTGYAINFAKGHLIQWWATGGVPTGVIQGQGTTSANAVGINLAESQLIITAQNGLTHTIFQGTSSAVNYLQLYHSQTLNPVVIGAAGSDTNVDIELLPQGSGNVRFGTYTAGTVSQTGYVSIKDQGGAVRRLLVG